MTEMSEMFIRSLHEGVVPATGCTEPIAVAYAAANCMHYLTDQHVCSIDVQVSPNVMKNAMAVMVPGVGEPGLLIAAATGALAGDPAAGLSVIADLDPELLPAIKELANSGKVTAGVAPVEDDLYVEVTITDKLNKVKVCIAGDHTNIFKIERDDQDLLEKPRPAAHEANEVKKYLQGVTFKDVWDFALNAPLSDIAFMLDSGTVNMTIAEAGLESDYGLTLGKSIDRAKNTGFGSGIEGDLENRILAYTAAASDARMGGASLPAMSNSGSGNQGISATVPVCVVANFVDANEEQLTRALTLSNLAAIYIHSFLPVLSAFCATDSAGMGAAAASIYLLGGDRKQAEMAIKNMAGDAAGMVCDGAGCSCAMKVATATSSMYRSVNLARQGVVIPASNGLVCEDIDETIRGIGKLGTIGMKGTDPAVLDVMMAKSKPAKTPRPKVGA